MTLLTAPATTETITCVACQDGEHHYCDTPWETHTSHSSYEPSETIVTACCCDAPTGTVTAPTPFQPGDPF